MLQVVQEKDISLSGRRGSTWGQLPSEGPWLPAGKNSERAKDKRKFIRIRTFTRALAEDEV